MLRLNPKGLILDDSTNVDDSTSIREFVATLPDHKHFPLEDPHGLHHHYICDAVDETLHVSINISKHEPELTDIVLSDYSEDSLVTYLSSSLLDSYES